MLAFLRGQASERKLRLFAVACCRRIWHLLPHEWSRHAVEAAERYADGASSSVHLAEARQRAGWAAAWSGHGEAAEAAAGTAAEPGEVAWVETTAARAGWAEASRGGQSQCQCDLLRDIFRPFRPSPPLPAAVLAWSDGIVVRLAQAMYEARDFSNLALLADALLDAGCADEALLAHCRSGGEHVRGCWAVDGVLGKS
jgi:hypothetical protein